MLDEGTADRHKGDKATASNDPGPPALLFKIGERVKVRHHEGTGKVVEYRGPLGPKGSHVYRVLLRRKPSPVYVELWEDQMIALEGQGEASPRRGGPPGAP